MWLLLVIFVWSCCTCGTYISPRAEWTNGAKSNQVLIQHYDLPCCAFLQIISSLSGSCQHQQPQVLLAVHSFWRPWSTILVFSSILPQFFKSQAPAHFTLALMKAFFRYHLKVSLLKLSSHRQLSKTSSIRGLAAKVLTCTGSIHLYPLALIFISKTLYLLLKSSQLFWGITDCINHSFNSTLVFALLLEGNNAVI